MIKVSKDYIGIIDGSKPYVVINHHGQKLNDVINGKVKESWWRICSTDLFDSALITIAFVKYINYNPTFINALSANCLSKKFGVDSPVATCSISGLIIGNILFFDDKYKSTQDIDLNINSSAEINIKRLNINLNDHIIIGRFNINKCNYYCDLTS